MSAKTDEGGRVIRGVPWEKYCHLLKTTECTKWFLYINSIFFFQKSEAGAVAQQVKSEPVSIPHGSKLEI